jgi:hypothetical protein
MIHIVAPKLLLLDCRRTDPHALRAHGRVRAPVGKFYLLALFDKFIEKRFTTPE